MMRRLDELPVYSSQPAKIPADYFNSVKLTMLRLEDTFRFSLPGYTNIDVVIDQDSWVCVDTSLQDLPLVAWVEFEVKGRDNLHEPVYCQKKYYHFMAAHVARDALEHINAYALGQMDEWLAREKGATKNCRTTVTKGHLSLVQ